MPFGSPTAILLCCAVGRKGRGAEGGGGGVVHTQGNANISNTGSMPIIHGVCFWKQHVQGATGLEWMHECIRMERMHVQQLDDSPRKGDGCRVVVAGVGGLGGSVAGRWR